MSAHLPEYDVNRPADQQPAHGVPSPALLERADAGLNRFLDQSPDLDTATHPTTTQ